MVDVMTADGAAAEFEFVDQGDEAVLRLRGAWTVGEVGRVDPELGALGAPAAGAVLCDVSGLSRLDTTGAWLILRTMAAFRAQGVDIRFAGVTAGHSALLDRVAANKRLGGAPRLASGGLTRFLDGLGGRVAGTGRLAHDMLGFLGLIIATGVRGLVHPGRLRLTATVHHMDHVGFRALPIVGLISFLIGVVLAYQGAQQLQKFGAEVFVVQMLEISVLREIAILLTAIVVAGRSASAFTSEIGSMKLQEEVDAMRSFGLDPIEFLVLPRMVALFLTLPLLGFFAAIMGLVGGALTAWLALDVSPAMFIGRFEETSNVRHLFVGLVKAPFFAIAIGLVGCFHGLLVEGSGESLGRQTTASVVQAIFLVIIIDAAFSILFASIGV